MRRRLASLGNESDGRPMQLEAPPAGALATAIAQITEALTPAAVVLYGSRAKGREGTSSDYDLAVLVAGRVPGWEETKQLQSALEATLGSSVDLVILDGASPILAMQALREGRLIDCRDPQALENFTVRTLTDYADLKIIRREAERRLMEPRRP